MEHTKADDDNKHELARLESQHEVMVHAMGKLVFAPIDFSDPGLRILDSGTANGRWLRDLRAETKAKHTYVGTDIVASLLPTNPPEGMSFVQQSITEPWPAEMNGTFDLVHQRFVLAGSAGTPLPTVIGGLAGLLKSGGWLQCVEMDVEDVEGNGPAVTDVLKVFREMFAGIGLGFNFAKKLKGVMEEVGLMHVEDTVVYSSHGAKTEKQELFNQSIEHLTSAIAPMMAVYKCKFRCPQPIGVCIY